MVYARPRTLDEAISVLSERDALLIGGGTDVYPSHVAKPIARDVVDVSRIAGMCGISELADYYRIGGSTTWTGIVNTPLPPAFDALKMAAREVGSIQIQNRGTVAGNLCNASPAADGIPPLLALDASVELVSRSGIRSLPLGGFITGYRRTAIAAGEILSAVIVPKTAGQSAFVKLGARRYLVISIIMAAAVIEKAADGSIARARVAVGAASAVAQRLPALERDLKGLPPGTRPSSIVSARHFEPLSPIDDVRATSHYRLSAATPLVGEALDRACGG